MIINNKIYEQMVELAKKTSPRESYGYLYGDEFVPGREYEASFGHFVCDPDQLFMLTSSRGKPTAFFHSHPCAALPSGWDLRFMRSTSIFWGPIPWLILSNTYELRCWVFNAEVDVVIK